MTAAVTNRVREAFGRPVLHGDGITVNPSIPVGEVENWRLEAIRRVVEYRKLPENWDADGSSAPKWAVAQSAIELIREIPCQLSTAPRIVPVSGGGYHFEWTSGDRDLEVSVEPDGSIETLRVERGMPIEDDHPIALEELFRWLTTQ